MDIRIYDVEHGDCFLILSSKNESILIDCGYNSSTGWKPSEGLLKQGFGERRKLHHLILTHPDQDHLADLPNVIEKFNPNTCDDGNYILFKPEIDLFDIFKIIETILFFVSTNEEEKPYIRFCIDNSAFRQLYFFETSDCYGGDLFISVNRHLNYYRQISDPNIPEPNTNFVIMSESAYRIAKEKEENLEMLAKFKKISCRFKPNKMRNVFPGSVYQFTNVPLT